MPEPLFLIWSIEHEAWWRPAWQGYTRELAEAGRYSLPAANVVLARANYVAVNECAIPVACVEPVGITVRIATDDEQQAALRDALIANARQAVLEGAGHDCGEWINPTGVCLLCGRSSTT